MRLSIFNALKPKSGFSNEKIDFSPSGQMHQVPNFDLSAQEGFELKGQN